MQSEPRAMPSAGAAAQRFEINRFDHLSQTAGGRLYGLSDGEPLFQLTLRLGDMSTGEADAWRCFVDAQRGPLLAFLGRDLKRPYPRAFPDGFAGLTRAGGSDPFDGTVLTWSLNGTRDVLSVTGLPEDFPLTLGDLAAFQWETSGSAFSFDARRALLRIVETVTGDEDGAASFAFEPPLFQEVPEDAVLTFAEPDCLMRLVPGQQDLGDEDTIGSRGGRIVALQDLIP